MSEDYENKHAFTRQLAAPIEDQQQAFQMYSVQNPTAARITHSH